YPWPRFLFATCTRERMDILHGSSLHGSPKVSVSEMKTRRGDGDAKTRVPQHVQRPLHAHGGNRRQSSRSNMRYVLHDIPKQRRQSGAC
ncbi:unnamed protein product, partial [Ectocarpus sp. 4 AP-2014]